MAEANITLFWRSATSATASEIFCGAFLLSESFRQNIKNGGGGGRVRHMTEGQLKKTDIRNIP